ncbi:MAG: FAD-dependent oxidoreductase [Deferrisomatales bacterium]|nr:FAD-dependent oxidoreductase [Deferrisomatales bacterium]
MTDLTQTKYLIVGCSHAGLAATEAIRLADETGSVAIVSRETGPVYSPTILPYVMSGEKGPGDIHLREPVDFEQLRVARLAGAAVKGVDAARRTVLCESGRLIEYEKLLLATGADATVPPFPGIESVPYLVVRTLEDAVQLRERARTAKSAIVIGAGLIAMHAAEKLAEAGLKVTVVVRRPVSLFAYFDATAAGVIEAIFADHGVRLATGSAVAQVAPAGGGCAVTLASGARVTGDLLLLAAGVQPRIGFLEGTGVEVDQGILVDTFMRTSVPGIWAAGDVAQAPGFFDPERTVNATLPNASVQGRIAGMDMAGDPVLKPYVGSGGWNTFNFFGNHAFSLGRAGATESADDIEVETLHQPGSRCYQKLVFENDRLVGVSAINVELDPGVLRELIERRTDLGAVREAFGRDPLNTGRFLMTELWR